MTGKTHIASGTSCRISTRSQPSSPSAVARYRLVRPTKTDIAYGPRKRNPGPDIAPPPRPGRRCICWFTAAIGDPGKRRTTAWLRAGDRGRRHRRRCRVRPHARRTPAAAQSTRCAVPPDGCKPMRETSARTGPAGSKRSSPPARTSRHTSPRQDPAKTGTAPLPALQGMLLVSGIYDLSGIPDSFLRDEARMTPGGSAGAWTPLDAVHHAGPARIVAYGMDETPPFLHQAGALHAKLRDSDNPRAVAGTRLNHMSVVLDLADPTPWGKGSRAGGVEPDGRPAPAFDLTRTPKIKGARRRRPAHRTCLPRRGKQTGPDLSRRCGHGSWKIHGGLYAPFHSDLVRRRRADEQRHVTFFNTTGRAIWVEFWGKAECVDPAPKQGSFPVEVNDDRTFPINLKPDCGDSSIEFTLAMITGNSSSPGAR